MFTEGTTLTKMNRETSLLPKTFLAKVLQQKIWKSPKTFLIKVLQHDQKT